MPDIAIGHIAELESAAPLERALAADHPGFRLSFGEVDDPDGVELRAPTQKTSFFWLTTGRGAVELRRGYRTQEGDGKSLPTDYEPDSLSVARRKPFHVIREAIDTCAPSVLPHLERLLRRRRGNGVLGDINADLWGAVNAEPDVDAWSSSSEVVDSLRALIDDAAAYGWSTKTTAGWEPVQAGDQLLALEERPVRVRGKFQYVRLDVPRVQGDEGRFSAARRLRYLRDTSGGCNPAFDAFRRLSTCWQVDSPAANRANSHVVHIAADTASTHYHPAPKVDGAFAQSELYIVLDPKDHGLRPASGTPALHAYPDIHDLTRFTTTTLRIGDVVYIPPGTGHRGIDVFANVVGVPGFKPQNEFPIDAAIAAAAGDAAPYNRHLVP